MRLKSSVAIVALSVVLLTPVMAQQTVRIMPYAPNRTIAERLLSSDQVVQVHRAYDEPVFDREPGPRDTVQGLLQGEYGTAVLVDVSMARGILVDEQRWIRTLFEGTVVEVLSNPTTTVGARVPLAKGNKVGFSLDGGELKIGHVVVRTTDAISFPAGRRYLVFLGARYTDADHLMLGTDPVFIEGNSLAAVHQSKTKLAGLTLDEVRTMARNNRK